MNSKVKWTLAFLGVMILSGYLTMSLVVRGRDVEVPMLIGLNKWDADSACKAAELYMQEKSPQYDELVPEGHVVKQEPPAGEITKRGRTVRVFLSKGSLLVYPPDLYRQSLRRAKILLQQNDLKLGQIASVSSDKVEADSVVAQNPAPMSKVGRDTSVNLLVSKGPRKITYGMPKLCGKQFDSARLVLKKVGLNLAHVALRVNENLPVRTVVEQSPMPGFRVQAGDKIDIAVSGRVDEESQGLTYRIIGYELPAGGNVQKRVKIELIDTRGTTVVYNEMAKSGTSIQEPVQISGTATYRIYVSGELVEEKELH